MQVVERCKSCGSEELRWEADKGWLTHGWRYLRCRACQDLVRAEAPAWVWAMYLIAAAAAVAAWWTVMR